MSSDELLLCKGDLQTRFIVVVSRDNSIKPCARDSLIEIDKKNACVGHFALNQRSFPWHAHSGFLNDLRAHTYTVFHAVLGYSVRDLFALLFPI
jgi:hypothetical protein